MTKVIKVENLSKAYQLGDFGTGTISRDLERFWARVRGKEDPFLKIGEVNDRTIKSDSNVVWSLKDINFDVEAGDSVGIIGRNGAGKSTLLKILSRVTSPTTGSVKVKGRIASLLEVGTGFHPELTGRENIFLNGAILGMRKAEIKRKFDAIVDFAGVERYIDTPVKRYSSGMYVRLAFAVAAHLESEILIVDEVLAVGDAEFQKKCLGKIGDVSKGEGRTVLFVSHNMEAILGLCNSGIYLNNGLVALQSNIHEVVSAYIFDNNQNGASKSVVETLNNKVKLFKFCSTTSKLTVFEDLKFSMVLESAVPNKVSGLCILIYNSYEKRVAIIDFRSIELETQSKSKTTIRIESVIKRLNLVPGSYNIGLFINSDLCTGDFLNLMQIQVTEPINSAFLPYPIEVRGAATFEHNFSIS